ncbi:cytochrome P450 9e2-like isoform X1 [Zootermopsis nevadensis]|uniref:cytochrome P450 9e2-like isoform X1 n=1 Tax=Zootermopsis nevadensis TaxID=136037 RepID=UPI000B8E7142|nr:cytochrome P450 9e2-like isoform X1 [Zootermopsis nevadensis]XP_021918282.1 cytochrome P450 9e2-like isoform X1 [Zootermopsis nevadensis]XP_021918283.1 cytochrome P450 9e2-like isoform X1 [Zootermopsis nevadensis]XP_021918284.1 cytochrome P450 9e2-like isoform X1 [Zootermopsis nevadensis]
MAVLDWSWSCSDWVLLLLVIGVILYFIGTSNYNHFSKQNVPFIKPVPFIGCMGPLFLRKQYFPQLMMRIYKDLEDHPYGGFFLFKQPIIMLKDPELIKTIAVKDFEYFMDHRAIFSKDGEPVWSRGLFSLKGQRWREMRSTLSPAFTSSKMKTMFVLLSECCEQFVNFLEQCYQHTPQKGCNIEKDGDVLVLEMKDFYTRYTNDVIATAAFGIGVDSLKNPTNEFYRMGQDLTYMHGLRAFKWLAYLAMPKLIQKLHVSMMSAKSTKFFSTLVLDTIATREREGIVRPDMLQLLMQAKKGTLRDDTSNSPGSKKINIEDDDIVAQAFLFFLAGFDTASTLLCFASHQLAVHAHMQVRLQEEIDETLQKNDGKFTYEAVNSMKYLDMVVSETLRLYPVVPAVDRVCIKPYTLKSDPPMEIHPGQSLFIPIIGLHRDPKYYPDPERFDPERFSEDNKHGINPLTYLPFGLGPRSCIGNRFALMETKLALVSLLSRFNVVLVAKTPVPIKIVQKGFNMSIEGGFWLGLEKRNP